MWTDNPPVPPSIIQAKIVKSVVIGETVKRTGSHLVESFDGYFILDLSNGKSRYGLKRDKWMELLKKEYGINDFSLLLPREAYERWKNKK